QRDAEARVAVGRRGGGGDRQIGEAHHAHEQRPDRAARGQRELRPVGGRIVRRPANAGTTWPSPRLKLLAHALLTTAICGEVEKCRTFARFARCILNYTGMDHACGGRCRRASQESGPTIDSVWWQRRPLPIIYPVGACRERPNPLRRREHPPTYVCKVPDLRPKP